MAVPLVARLATALVIVKPDTVIAWHRQGFRLILAHERRRVVHVGVTDHPTAAWTAQQLREAFPWSEAPHYPVRDRDAAFHAWTATAKAMDIHEVISAARSPWQKDYASYCTAFV